MNTKKGLYCEVCNTPLSTWSKNRICSGKCRAKRARDKREALSRAAAMGTQFVNWQRMLNDKVIDPAHAKKLLYEVWDALYEFKKAIDLAEGKAQE